MNKVRTVLVVSRIEAERTQLASWLSGEGFEVSAAVDFDSAKRALEIAAPDVLVADVKLGAYNGLHLAIWASGRGLATKVVLIGEPDLVLQREAMRTRAVYLTPPLDGTQFLAAVDTLLASFFPARRSPRKRVALDATVNGVGVSVVDLSYEGLRLEVPDAEGVSLPAFLTVQLSDYDLSIRVKRVWLGRPPHPRGALWCGVALPPEDGSSANAWRFVVDTVSGFDSLQAESAAR